MPLDPQLLAAFLVATWVLILTPRPDMFFVIGQSLPGGARRGWAAGLLFLGLGVRLLAGGRPA
jgi:threonine/homoserine/homoserine lactone efflux protein